MGIQVVGPSGSVAEVGIGSSSAQHITQKPIPASVGHYRTAVKLTMATTQGANSRLFEIRNTHATNLIIPTRIFVMAAAAGTVTTGYLGEFGLWKLTGFSAVDTTNTVTPTSGVKRGSMTAYPGNAAVRHVTVAGAAAGMTGGTLTKDGNMLASLVVPLFTLAATTPVVWREMFEDIQGSHPLVLTQNEGILIENVVVGSGTANVVHVVIDVSWAETSAY